MTAFCILGIVIITFLVCQLHSLFHIRQMLDVSHTLIFCTCIRSPKWTIQSKSNLSRLTFLKIKLIATTLKTFEVQWIQRHDSELLPFLRDALLVTETINNDHLHACDDFANARKLDTSSN